MTAPLGHQLFENARADDSLNIGKNELLQLRRAVDDLGQAAEHLERDHHFGLRFALTWRIIAALVRIRIGHDDHPANFEDGIKGDDHLGHIGQDNKDPITRAHPFAMQHVGELVHFFVQLPVGQLLVVKDGRCAFGQPSGGAFQECE